MINAILNTIILVGIVVDFLYIHRIEEDNKVLKEWIKFCYHIDLDRLTEFVERSKDEPQPCEPWTKGGRYVFDRQEVFKTEPTISKMEQVDEPQTDCAWK